MKVGIFGSTGEAGSRLVKVALAAGYEVIAPVRNPEKARGVLPADVVPKPVDFSNTNALAEAIADADYVINAAGYVAHGADYIALVGRIISASELALGSGGRFWMFGGAGVLDVPGRSIMTLDLPGVPKLFEPHRANYEAVKATALEWSMMCPGPMVPADGDKPRDDLIIQRDVWPIDPPGFTRILPNLALSLSFKAIMPRLMVSYEDVAKIIITNLAPNGPYSRARVSVALPDAPNPNGKQKTKWEAAS